MSRGQRGIALISVLLVMSLALMITGALLRSHRLSLQSSAQVMQHLQLRQLAMAGETWALLQLQSAARAQSKTVDLTQDWARTTPGFDVPGAQIHLEIEDLSGRFNLNALLAQGQIAQVTRTRWARLLETLDVPPVQLSQVGALKELSQLRLLPQVDGQLLRRIEPWVALLPADAVLNINTAPVPVLRALDGVQATTAEALARQRSTAPWSSVQAFTQDPLLAAAGVSGHGLGISSRWFRIRVQVVQGNARVRLATDVERDRDTHRHKVLQRRLLPSSDPEMPQ